MHTYRIPGQKQFQETKQVLAEAHSWFKNHGTKARKKSLVNVSNVQLDIGTDTVPFNGTLHSRASKRILLVKLSYLQFFMEYCSRST